MVVVCVEFYDFGLLNVVMYGGYGALVDIDAMHEPKAENSSSKHIGGHVSHYYSFSHSRAFILFNL